MAGELFLATTGLQAIHIPYKGGSPAATDLVGGQIDFYFAGMPVGLPLYKGDKVKALAVTSKNRFSGAPELVTIQEAGVKGYEMALWQGMFVPAGTSPAIIKELNNSVLKILETPEMKDRFQKAGVQIFAYEYTAIFRPLFLRYCSVESRYRESQDQAGLALHFSKHH